MIDYENVEIAGIDFSSQGAAEVYQNLKVLYTTSVGTVPFDRGFGIDFSFLDLPLPVVKTRLIAEYIVKTRRYEPRVTVYEVLFEANKDGKLIPKVVVTNGPETE